MKVRKIKFIWGASRVIKGRWYLGLFGLYDRVEGVRHDGLAISLRGLLLWSLGMACAAYVAGATALFWVWQKNPYSLLSYHDALFYPVRRTEIAEKKGRAFIAQGTDMFRARKYHDAATLLRLGLARVPRDLSARLLLAQYYTLASQRPAALRILGDGLTDEYPGRAYLETLFNAAEVGEDYDRVAKIAERYEPRLRAPATLRDYRWVIGRHFVALSAAGRHAEALALAESEEPGELAREHRILALLGVGRPNEALTALAEWGTLSGADRRTVARLRIRALREGKKFEEMEAAIAEFRGMAPADPAPAVYGIVQRLMGGREATADAALADYFFRFGGSTQNLILLAEPLAEIRDLPRVQRCLTAAMERGYPLGRYKVLAIQLHLHRSEWAAANQLLESLPPETGREALQAEVWRTWMRRLLDAAMSPADAGQVALVEWVRERPWPISIFRRTVDVLRAAGRLETTRDVLTVASRMFPTSTWAQAEGAKVAAELAARETPAIAAAPAPSGPRLPGERIFFERLDTALAAKKWDEAAQLVREARAARPAPNWVGVRDSSLWLAQVRIGQGSGDRHGMMTAARLYLNGDSERSRQLLAAAQEFFQAGDKDSAMAVMKEVLGRSPNFPLAVRLLAEWEPKAEKID